MFCPYQNNYFFALRALGEDLRLDHCPNLVTYSPDVLKKKTKVLDFLIRTKICKNQCRIKSSEYMDKDPFS